MRFTCYVSDSDSEECYDPVTSTHPRTIGNQATSVNVNGSSNTNSDTSYDCEPSDDSGSDDSDSDSGSDSDDDSVISATSTLCSLAEEASDDTNHPTINVGAEPEAKHGPHRAPLLLPAPTHTPVDDSLGEECKALVIYNPSHERVPLEEEGRAPIANDSDDHGSENTPYSDIRKEEKRAEAIPMKWKDESLVLWDFSRSRGAVVKVEADDTNARPSEDAQEHDEPGTGVLNDVLAPNQENDRNAEGEVDDQLLLPEAGRKACGSDAGAEGPVAEGETQDWHQHVETLNTALHASPEPAPPVEEVNHEIEYGNVVEAGPHSYLYPATHPEPEPPIERLTHEYECAYMLEARQHACAYVYPTPAPVPTLVPFPTHLEPPVYELDLAHKQNSRKDKYKLARELRREIHLHRQQVKRILRKHKGARKTLRDAVAAIRADLLEWCYIQCGWRAPLRREEDVVPMDVDEEYDVGSFKEGERSTVPGPSHRPAREAPAQARDRKNEQNFSRRSLFANRSWYWVHKVMQVFTPNQLDLLVPWLSSWDGTRPNQRNWLVRSLRCTSLRPRLDPFPAISFNVERTKRSENL